MERRARTVTVGRLPSLDTAGRIVRPQTTKAISSSATLGITFGASIARRERSPIVAGSGKRGFAGDHGPAIAAQFGLPISVAVDRAGDIFIADDTSNRIRRIDANTGIIDTVAGTGDITNGPFVAQEFRGEGDLATAARMTHPQSLALDQNENLLFVVNDRVCRIDQSERHPFNDCGDREIRVQR